MIYYRSVLFDLDLISIILFLVLPVLSVGSVFLMKRTLLWIAPVISTIFMLIISVAASGLSLLTVGEYRGMFLGICVPIHFAVSAVLTAIAYVVSYILRQRQNRK